MQNAIFDLTILSSQFLLHCMHPSSSRLELSCDLLDIYIQHKKPNPPALALAAVASSAFFGEAYRSWAGTIPFSAASVGVCATRAPVNKLTQGQSTAPLPSIDRQVPNSRKQATPVVVTSLGASYVLSHSPQQRANSLVYQSQQSREPE
jgi:hypothetical protein